MRMYQYDTIKVRLPSGRVCSAVVGAKDCSYRRVTARPNLDGGWSDDCRVAIAGRVKNPRNGMVPAKPMAFEAWAEGVNARYAFKDNKIPMDTYIG